MFGTTCGSGRIGGPSGDRLDLDVNASVSFFVRRRGRERFLTPAQLVQPDSW